MSSPALSDSRRAERAAAGALAALDRPTYPLHRLVAGEGLVAAWERRATAARAAGRRVPDPEEVLAAGEACGARLLLPEDEEWPPGLGDLARNLLAHPAEDVRRAGRDHGPPLALWVRGSGKLAGLAGRAVALVGARAASAYGTWVAADLAAGLAERGATVVSGGAFGIDAAAHRGAASAYGHGVAVLPGGIDVVYPAAHEALFAAVAERGLLVAEQPPGTRPRRDGFLVRNRLIAALSSGVVLVEAGLRSGARNTLAHAAALDRVRLVVPGPVTSAQSAGCHQALRLDPAARLVTTAAEVLEEVGALGELAPLGSGSRDARDDVGAEARAVLDALPAREAWSAGRIAAALGLPTVRVLGLARVLADHGLLARVGDGFALTDLGRAPGAR